MLTKRRPDVRLRPGLWDALVVLVVLALAAVGFARVRLLAADAESLCVVVSIDGAVAERFALGTAERTYQNRGYTVHLRADSGGVRVDHADCPTQDCVRTGTISRAGQSIVCLRARIAVTLEGAPESADYDAIAGGAP